MLCAWLTDCLTHRLDPDRAGATALRRRRQAAGLPAADLPARPRGAVSGRRADGRRTRAGLRTRRHRAHLLDDQADCHRGPDATVRAGQVPVGRSGEPLRPRLGPPAGVRRRRPARVPDPQARPSDDRQGSAHPHLRPHLRVHAQPPRGRAVPGSGQQRRAAGDGGGHAGRAAAAVLAGHTVAVRHVHRRGRLPGAGAFREGRSTITSPSTSPARWA